MSTLTFVRHAQASFFDEDYDRLSQLGELQARRLGEYFVRLGEKFDSVYVGPAKRHRRSANIVGRCMIDAGLSWPKPRVVKTLDEHAADLFLEHFAREADQCPHELRDLAHAYRIAKSPSDIQKSFQKLFEAVVHLWVEQKVELPKVGTWDDYRGGVYQAMRMMTANRPRGSHVLAFGSTGSITVALQYVLQADEKTALHLGWRLRNCSLTRFIFSSARITLDTFNSLSHLDDPSLITFR
ncbi:MAG: histidine phosphatase family protein [Planctomycetaceae bacterium]